MLHPMFEVVLVSYYGLTEQRKTPHQKIQLDLLFKFEVYGGMQACSVISRQHIAFVDKQTKKDDVFLGETLQRCVTLLKVLKSSRGCHSCWRRRPIHKGLPKSFWWSKPIAEPGLSFLFFFLIIESKRMKSSKCSNTSTLRGYSSTSMISEPISEIDAESNNCCALANTVLRFKSRKN